VDKFQQICAIHSDEYKTILVLFKQLISYINRGPQIDSFAIISSFVFSQAKLSIPVNILTYIINHLLIPQQYILQMPVRVRNYCQILTPLYFFNVNETVH